MKPCLHLGQAYITRQLPGLHGVHGLLIDAFIVALQAAVVLLSVFDLFQMQKGGERSACRAEQQVWILCLGRFVTHIAGELADFGSVLKLWSLTEIDAVTFTVLQILLILHLQGSTVTAGCWQPPPSRSSL